MSGIKNHNPILEKGIALYNFFSTEEEELTLEEGDLIDIIEEADDGWWKGIKISGNVELNKEGIFPYNYLKKLSTMDFYQLSQTDSPRQQFVRNIIQASQQQAEIEKQQHQQQQQQQQQYYSSSSIDDSYNANRNSNYSSSNGNGSNTSINIKDNETHLIAALSDPMEKRPSSRTIGNSGDNNFNNQIDEQRQQEELLRLQKEQMDEQKRQNNNNNSSSGGGGGITIKLNDVAKEGFLIKKGHIRRNWNVRWFQLRRNTLTYSKTPNDIKLSGTIILTPESEIDIATNMKRTNCFQIKNQSFVFYCSSQSQSDMESWITALNTAKNVH